MITLTQVQKLPEITAVQIQTASPCNADCVFPLAGDTLVFTPEGNQPIRDLVGTTTLWVPRYPLTMTEFDYAAEQRFVKMEWKNASAKSFGIQPVVSLVLGMGGRMKCVKATPEHRWKRVVKTKDQPETLSDFVPTSELRIGDFLPCAEWYGDCSIEQWQVLNITARGESREVFCATVPGSEMFALADGILTGNCPWIESEHNTVNKGRMSDEMWHRTLAYLAPFEPTIQKMVPYLMNEPLLDKTIFTKIEDIRKIFPRAVVEISTNGMALTEKVIDQLIDSFVGKPHDLWISHHGIDKASLEHIMAINYDKATANVVNLIRKSAGRVTIRMRGLGESRDGKHKFFTHQQYVDHWADLAKVHSLNMNNVHVDWGTFHDRAGGLHRTDRGANLLNVGKVRDIGPGHAPFYCTRIDKWVHVMWDGRIRLCCMDYSGEVSLPSLKDMTLVEYFNSPEYHGMKDMVEGRAESRENFICAKCISPGG